MWKKELRGYDCNEDLFVPGYFEMPIKKGESIYFSASLSEATPSGLSRKFLAEIDKRVSRSSYKNCLINAAQQFIEKRGKKNVYRGRISHGLTPGDATLLFRYQV